MSQCCGHEERVDRERDALRDARSCPIQMPTHDTVKKRSQETTIYTPDYDRDHKLEFPGGSFQNL